MNGGHDIENNEPHAAIRFVTKLYARLLFAGLALIPAYLIGYLLFLQEATWQFEGRALHDIAIAAATLAGLIATYVTWQCHCASGEPLLRWMTLGFGAFVLMYALPPAFAGLARDNTQLVLLHGPAARLVMSILLLTGQLSRPQASSTGDQRPPAAYWLAWAAVFLGVDVLIALPVNPAILPLPSVQLSIEGGAFLFSALNAAVLILRRISSPPMQIYGVSVTCFTFSSLAFMLSRPSSQMWWLAQAIFAGGFSLLSYAVLEAFGTTRSLSAAHSHAELLARLVEAMRRTENTLQALQTANQRLEHLAATDSLTGAANRLKFIENIEAEIARAKRSGAPFSVLALDLDNFKWVNDRYGHQIGDKVLQEFVQVCRNTVRPYDGVGRIGGEEFMVLLPEARFDAALRVGERIRLAVASMPFASDTRDKLSITVSVGISQFGKDGNTIDTILRAADRRLNQAKRLGRNRVIAS